MQEKENDEEEDLEQEQQIVITKNTPSSSFVSSSSSFASNSSSSFSKKPINVSLSNPKLKTIKEKKNMDLLVDQQTIYCVEEALDAAIQMIQRQWRRAIIQRKHAYVKEIMKKNKQKRLQAIEDGKLPFYLRGRSLSSKDFVQQQQQQPQQKKTIATTSRQSNEQDTEQVSNNKTVTMMEPYKPGNVSPPKSPKYKKRFV
jgi:hypothetical protein